MKKLLLFTLVLSSFISCSQHSSKTDILPRQAFIDSINKPGAQVADIRTPEEHAEEGNFPQAVNIDFTRDDFYDQIQLEFDKTKPLYIHCKRGLKSHESIKKLQQLGFMEIYELEGGYDDWQGEDK